MRVPYERLSADTLRAVITEFVTREGTEYGEREISLDEKVASVLGQLRMGTAVLIFDSDSQSTTVVASNDPVLRGG
ncbi:MAG: YheU family protein [Deltaproteobacteria bacterium]|nr:YheU family protein [Deltaproteobacteria bacterium]